jgi:hypothetical protein
MSQSVWWVGAPHAVTSSAPVAMRTPTHHSAWIAAMKLVLNALLFAVCMNQSTMSTSCVISDGTPSTRSLYRGMTVIVPSPAASSSACTVRLAGLASSASGVRERTVHTSRS